MKKTLISLSIAAFLGSLAFQASASAPMTLDPSIARAERVEKKDQVGALDSSYQLAREASEGPRGRDHERPGDRQRRGGRG